MTYPSRRGFLGHLAALLAAPSVVQALAEAAPIEPLPPVLDWSAREFTAALPPIAPPSAPMDINRIWRKIQGPIRQAYSVEVERRALTPEVRLTGFRDQPAVDWCDREFDFRTEPSGDYFDFSGIDVDWFDA